MTAAHASNGSTVRLMVLGRRLRDLRAAAGMSFEDAALVLDVAPMTIRRMEIAKGRWKLPYVRSLLEAYGVPEVEAAAALVVRGGRALAVRRPPRGLMGGLWELPGDDLTPRETPARGLRRALRERVGLDVGPLRKAGSVEHVFSHRRLRLHVYRCEAQGGRVRLAGPDAHRWLAASRLAGQLERYSENSTVSLLGDDPYGAACILHLGFEIFPILRLHQPAFGAVVRLFLPLCRR